MRVLHRVTALRGIPALCFLTCFLWLPVHGFSLHRAQQDLHCCSRECRLTCDAGHYFSQPWWVRERGISVLSHPSNTCYASSFYISFSFLVTPFSHASLGLGSLTFLKPDRRGFSLETTSPRPNSISLFMVGEVWEEEYISLFREPTLWAFLRF